MNTKADLSDASRGIMTPGGFPLLNVQPNWAGFSGSVSGGLGFDSRVKSFSPIAKRSLWASREYAVSREFARRSGAGL